MTEKKIPAEATHVSVFYGILSYWKWALGIKIGEDILYYGVESNDPFYGWWCWDEAKRLWKPQSGVRSSTFKKLY